MPRYLCKYFARTLLKSGGLGMLNGDSDGEMAEWSKAAASKAVVPLKSGTVGSNPTLSL